MLKSNNFSVPRPTGIMGTLPAFSLPLRSSFNGVILARAKSADFWFHFPSIEVLLRPWADCYLCTSGPRHLSNGPVILFYDLGPELSENQTCIDIICGCSLGRMTLHPAIKSLQQPPRSFLFALWGQGICNLHKAVRF